MENRTINNLAGRCRELSEQAVKDDPTLTLTRGTYMCSVWGPRKHWWTVRADRSIYDPTAEQFPSKGTGDYIPFDGYHECEYCGKRVAEADVYFVEPHVYCSCECYGRDVM